MSSLTCTSYADHPSVPFLMQLSCSASVVTHRCGGALNSICADEGRVSPPAASWPATACRAARAHIALSTAVVAAFHRPQTAPAPATTPHARALGRCRSISTSSCRCSKGRVIITRSPRTRAPKSSHSPDAPALVPGPREVPGRGGRDVGVVGGGGLR